MFVLKWGDPCPVLNTKCMVQRHLVNVQGDIDIVFLFVNVIDVSLPPIVGENVYHIPIQYTSMIYIANWLLKKMELSINYVHCHLFLTP